MSLSQEQLAQIRAQSKQVRAGRKQAVLVLSGVTGGTFNQYTEETSGGTEVWVTASGVVSLYTRRQQPQIDVGGKTLPTTWFLSFDYEDIQGYETAEKVKIGTITYNIEERQRDYWGTDVTHIDFFLVEE